LQVAGKSASCNSALVGKTAVCEEYFLPVCFIKERDCSVYLHTMFVTIVTNRDGMKFSFAGKQNVDEQGSYKLIN